MTWSRCALALVLWLIVPATLVTAGPDEPAPHLPDRVVVMTFDGVCLETDRFDPGNNPRTGLERLDTRLTSLGVTRVAPFYPGTLRRPPLESIARRLRVLHLPPGLDATTVAEELHNLPGIQDVGLVALPRLFYTPDDPLYCSQWHLGRIQAPAAWDLIRAPDTRTSVVALIDTGLDLEHPEFLENLWVNPGEDLNGNGVADPSDRDGVDSDGNGLIDDLVGWDFADNDGDPQETQPHGSGVGACISAVTDNGIQGAAVGFGTRLMVLKGIDDQGQLAEAYQAMLYAADHGADVINCSWGIGLHQEFEQAIIDAVREAGSLIVAAGGQEDQPTYPAGYGNVLGVSATDAQDHLPPFAPYGSAIDICAPGVNILTLWEGEAAWLTGTSFAAGMVSGTLGLLRARHPQLEAEELEALLLLTADNIDALNPAHAGQLGAGRLNALGGVVSGVPVVPPSVALRCRPNPFNPRTSISFHIEDAGRTRLRVYDVRGRLAATLLDANLTPGEHRLVWEAGAFSSGSYFLVLDGVGGSAIRKTTLVK